ncbi:MAG: hypothetical protein AB8B82_08550 [Roseovarius sp.]
MADQTLHNAAHNVGSEQVVHPKPTQTATAGAAWIKAAADNAVADRAWTISRIDSALGSIA